MADTRPLWQIKASAAQRYLAWHGLTLGVDYIRVSEFPKSGGTWLCQMLSDASGIDFPRHRFLPYRRCIVHSHQLPRAIDRGLYVVRDGRDIMVSAYHHFLIDHPSKPQHLLRHWQGLMGDVDYGDVRAHLPRFIEIFFEKYQVGGRVMNWAQHTRLISDSFNFKPIRYEDMLKDARAELTAALAHLDMDISADAIDRAVQNNSFKKKSGRAAGVEDKSSFLRKGIAGDWQNYFDKKACLTFDQLAGDMLVQLGYEPDHSWIDRD